MKKTAILFTAIVSLLVASCAPGAQYTVPPDLTLVPGTDIPGQVADYVSRALTQTAFPATATPIPGDIVPTAQTSFSRKIHQSSFLGVQFSYPAPWYLQELPSNDPPGVVVTSFDPANPPHKLEWTEQTVSMMFGFKVFATPPASFDAWVESAKQAALARQLSIYAEERFLIANQPAARLTLVSGSGGILDQVLTILNGRYHEIDVEGNFILARTVLNSIQPFVSEGLKPADSDTPAAGICGESQDGLISIVLGVGPDGLPKAGRCIAVNPTQRIKLINQSNGPFNIKFADYVIELPLGNEVILDKPVGEYLAIGVHFLPLGPELWVKPSIVATATTIPPTILRTYSNSEVGYSLTLPANWFIDENGMVNSLNKEVIFSPPNAEPFIAYLSISLDFRTLDQIKAAYEQNVPDASREDVNFYGISGIRYIYPTGRNEYFIPYDRKIFLIATDRPNDGTVQLILMSIQFLSSSVDFSIGLADNGNTIAMNVGDRLLLNIGSEPYEWQVTVDYAAVLSLEQNVTPSGGILGVYRANRPGSTSLTATGNPKCFYLVPPCLLPSTMFRITVVVQ